MVTNHVVWLKDLSVMVARAEIGWHTFTGITEVETSGTETAFLTHPVTAAVRQG